MDSLSVFLSLLEREKERERQREREKAHRPMTSSGLIGSDQSDLFGLSRICDHGTVDALLTSASRGHGIYDLSSFRRVPCRPCRGIRKTRA